MKMNRYDFIYHERKPAIIVNSFSTSMLLLIPIMLALCSLAVSCRSKSATSMTAPSAPSGVSASAGVRKIIISWNSVASANAYNIYWKNAQGVATTDSKIPDITPPYSHTELTSGIPYYYRVTAINAAGESLPSEAVSAMPYLTAEEAAADGVVNVPTELPTIQAGLNAAGAGQTVLVHDGTYKENILWPAVDGILLKSKSGAAKTLIDGQGKSSVIIIDSDYTITSATLIEGFTIANGNLTQVIHTDYSLAYDYDGGGGIHLWCASPTIKNNLITSNRSSLHGGGISASWDSDPVIENNTITSNSSGKDGGGIYCRNMSNAVITNNVIKNNYADGCGGGLFTSPASDPATISGNDISGNNDSACPSLSECGDGCIATQVQWPEATEAEGTGGGGAGNDACTSCIHSCSGHEGCCTGVGCMCYDECMSQCNEFYCPWGGGDCWCIG